MLPGALPFHWHPGSMENPSRDTLLFLDRPAVPGPLLALEMAPQFLPSFSRGLQATPRRRVALIERFFDRPLSAGW